MKTEFRVEGQNYVMSFEGRLDTPASHQVGRDMRVLYDCEGHDIILDCSKLEYISSAGLRVLLSAKKKINEQGSMKIKNVSEAIMEVFEITGFNEIMTIE